MSRYSSPQYYIHYNLKLCNEQSENRDQNTIENFEKSAFMTSYYKTTGMKYLQVIFRNLMVQIQLLLCIKKFSLSHLFKVFCSLNLTNLNCHRYSKDYSRSGDYPDGTPHKLIKGHCCGFRGANNKRSSFSYGGWEHL